LRCARRCRCAPARCSLGLWIDSFRCCRAFRAARSFDGTFRLAVQPLRRPSTRTSREGNGVPALSGSVRSDRSLPRRVDCDLTRWLRHLPKETPRPHPNMGPEGLWDADGSNPERRFHRVGPSTRRCEVPTSSRRISEETRSRPSARSEERQPVVRARAPHPSAVARVHDGETARRGRSHPEVCASACHSRVPRRILRRTQSAGSRRTSLSWRARRRHPEVGHCGLVAPASPASWRAGSGQTVIVFTGTAAARSEDRVASQIPKNRRAGAEAPRVRLVPHIPPVVVIRREHRSARAEMDRDPSLAVPTEVESASVPSAPKRSRSPDR